MEAPPADRTRDALAVCLRGVTQRFRLGLGRGRREVLRDVDLELTAGGCLALLGPNGSGKSSLLRLVAGVDEPARGEVRVLGGSPRDPAVRRRVGWMPEDSPFPPELRPLAALELLGSLDGMPTREARERGARLLERVGLAGELRTNLGRFSRGMLRRFGLAQAFLDEPRLLLLDEPTAGLDAPGFEALEVLVGEARAGGATLVISSHLVSDVQRQCEELAVLVEGRVAARGAPRELLADGESDGNSADLEVAGLDRAGLDALAARARDLGGRVVDVRPSQASLIALYRRLGAHG